MTFQVFSELDIASGGNKRRSIFNPRWKTTYGLKVENVDPESGEPLSLVCQFCENFGREEGSDIRKRKRTQNVKVWVGKFRSDKIKEHVKRNHSLIYDRYTNLSAADKETFFEARSVAYQKKLGAGGEYHKKLRLNETKPQQTGGALPQHSFAINVPNYSNFMDITVGVLTINDSCFKGESTDESGPLILSQLYRHSVKCSYSISSVTAQIVPNYEDEIVKAMNSFIRKGCNLVLTTGATGIGLRDFAPEAARKVFDVEIPGVAELLRKLLWDEEPMIVLSRAVVGVSGSTVIATLPGKPQVVSRWMDDIAPLLNGLLSAAAEREKYNLEENVAN